MQDVGHGRVEVLGDLVDIGRAGEPDADRLGLHALEDLLGLLATQLAGGVVDVAVGNTDVLGAVADDHPGVLDGADTVDLNNDVAHL